MLLSEVVTRFTADVGGYRAGISEMIGMTGGLGPAIAAGVAGAAAVIVGVGVAATHMAADFEAGKTRLVTGAGDVTDNMQKMGEGMLKVSTDTGILTNGANGLNQAMYLIISSGQRGAQALDTLKAAAQGAQIEQANVVDVSNALSTAMTDYGTKQYSATQYMNGFIAAVSTGKITLEQLSQAMSPILPVAAAMGVSFADISSAMSTMTDAGMSADRAATGLRFLMQSLEVPTAKASKAFAEWGVNTQQLADTMKVSLPQALQLIYDAAKKAGPEGSQPFNKAISDMIGGQRSLQAFLDLTGTHLQAYEQNTKNVSTAMSKAASDVNGWAKVQGDFNIQLDKAHAAFDAMLIQLGTKLLPVLTPIAGQVANVVAQFGNWVSKTDFSGLASSIQGVATALSHVRDFMGQVGTFAINSQSWKDAATSIGQASQQLGLFVQNASKVATTLPAITIGLQENTKNTTLWQQATDWLGSGVHDVGTLFSGMGAAANAALDKIQGKMPDVSTAFLLLGNYGEHALLSIADAQRLVEMHFTTVRDDVSGAVIDLQKYIKTSDLSGSSTVTMAQALALVGKGADGILTAADYSALLAMRIGNVNDAVNHTTIDVKKMASGVSQFVDVATLQMQKWFDYLKTGGTQSFDAWQAADAKATAAFLANQAAMRGSAAQTHTQLQTFNKDASDRTGADAKATASFLANQAAMRGSADQTHAHLLALNGPYKPNVVADSVNAAAQAAINALNHLHALNGQSVWTAYVNTVNTTYYSQVGGSNIRRSQHGSPDFPGGLTWVGEAGPELVSLPQHASIYSNQQSRAMAGGGGGGGGGSATYILEVDGRVLAEALGSHLSREIRLQLAVR